MGGSNHGCLNLYTLNLYTRQHVAHVPMVDVSFRLRGAAGEIEAYRRRVQQQMSRVEAAVRRAGISGSAVIEAHAHPVRRTF
jgi:hypothetical protein